MSLFDQVELIGAAEKAARGWGKSFAKPHDEEALL
jgi:hypothetical protein